MVAWENRLPTACEYERILAMIGVRIRSRISWQLSHSDLDMLLPTSLYFRLPKRRKFNLWVDDDCNLRSFAYIPKRDILKRVLCIFLGHATIYTTNNLLSSQNVTFGQFFRSNSKNIVLQKQHFWIWWIICSFLTGIWSSFSAAEKLRDN